MANEFISVQEIARNLLPRLADNLVMPNLCYKDYSADFQDGKGATVLAQLPYYFTASDFADGGAISVQDIKEKAVPVTLDHLATVDVAWGALANATDINDKKVQEILDGMANALAEKINKDGLEQYKYVPASVGTAGTTPDDLEDFANARKVLNANGAELSGRCAVWDVEADAKFTQIGNLVKVSEAGAAAALREGEIGRVFGMDNYMSQAVAVHTTGAAGSPAIDLAGGYQAGATAIHVDGLTAAFIVGDRFTLGGEQYVVVEAGALASADQDIVIYPALKKAAANDAAITVVASYTANIAFQKRAFAFVTRPLVAPADKESYTTSYNGLTIRVVKGYDQSTKRTTLSADILYGYKTCVPELACVVLG